MAATKKTTSTAKRKPATRKPAARKTATTTARKRTTSRKKAAPMRTLHVSKEGSEFISLRFTRQTLYWTIIAIAVLALGIWVAVLNYQIQSIYDKIDAASASNSIDYMHYKNVDRDKK